MRDTSQLQGKGYYPGMEAEMLEQLKEKNRIVIFGSGMNGKSVLHFLTAHGIEPVCFADNAKDKWGTTIEGVEIKCPEEHNFSGVDAVVVTPYEQVYVDAIRKQLLELDVKEEIILNFKDFCPTMLEREQYFDPDIIKLHENEVFVDAGVLNLGTSLRFMEECQKSHVQNFKIHAFEPDGASYRRCIEIQKGIPDVNLKLYNAGLWSEDTTLYFAEMGNGASRISKAETGTSIKTVALDGCVSDPITFIKMDIEGSELEALKGCREIIRKYRPRLAICVYHKKRT